MLKLLLAERWPSFDDDAAHPTLRSQGPTFMQQGLALVNPSAMDSPALYPANVLKQPKGRPVHRPLCRAYKASESAQMLSAQDNASRPSI